MKNSVLPLPPSYSVWAPCPTYRIGYAKLIRKLSSALSPSKVWVSPLPPPKLPSNYYTVEFSDLKHTPVFHFRFHKIQVSRFLNEKFSFTASSIGNSILTLPHWKTQFKRFLHQIQFTASSKKFGLGTVVTVTDTESSSERSVHQVLFKNFSFTAFSTETS